MEDEWPAEVENQRLLVVGNGADAGEDSADKFYFLPVSVSRASRPQSRLNVFFFFFVWFFQAMESLASSLENIGSEDESLRIVSLFLCSYGSITSLFVCISGHGTVGEVSGLYGIPEGGRSSFQSIRMNHIYVWQF